MQETLVFFDSQKRAAYKIFRVDGDYVKQDMLLIPKDQFRPADLTKLFRSDRQYHLAIALEVAKHLPPECAETFVDSLTRHSKIVLFWRATPFQGGINHINLQWAGYWARLFRVRGYLPIDSIRFEDQHRFAHTEHFPSFPAERSGMANHG